MRDKLGYKDIQYYKKYIAGQEKYSSLLLEKMENHPNRRHIEGVIMISQLNQAIAMYSIGAELSEIEVYVKAALSYWINSWGEQERKARVSGPGQSRLYSLRDHVHLSWAISMGLIYDSCYEQLKIISDLVEVDIVSDVIIDTLLSPISTSRIPKPKDDYQPHSHKGLSMINGLMRTAIWQQVEDDSKAAIKSIEKYLEKKWYQNQENEVYLFGSHRRENEYFGYWAFEVAACAVILDIDDSSFRDHKYYPTDYADALKQKLGKSS